MLYAHRVAYELVHGDLPDGLNVLHTCDNPPCCNPSHLFRGTQLENIRDRTKKNRQATRGAHGRAKLTDKKVENIRREYVRGSRTHGGPALGRKYGVTGQAIRYAVRGKTW